MSLVHNERTKLTAAWFNTLATAVIAAGVFAPSAALLYGLAPFPADLRVLYSVVVGCFLFGCALHLIGRTVLRRLHE